MLEPIWKTKPETASRLRGRIERILDWAKVRQYREGENPARWRGHLHKVFPARSRVRRVQHHPAAPVDSTLPTTCRCSIRYGAPLEICSAFGKRRRPGRTRTAVSWCCRWTSSNGLRTRRPTVLTFGVHAEGGRRSSMSFAATTRAARSSRLQRAAVTNVVCFNSWPALSPGSLGDRVGHAAAFYYGTAMCRASRNCRSRRWTRWTGCAPTGAYRVAAEGKHYRDDALGDRDAGLFAASEGQCAGSANTSWRVWTRRRTSCFSHQQSAHLSAMQHDLLVV